MTLAATIQSAIDAGNAQAANVLGIPYTQYRPQGTGNPLATGNQIGIIQALFSQDPKFTKLPKTKSDEFYGYFDGGLTQVGDYLTDTARTFFVAAQQPMLPYLVINCERIVTLSRPNTGAVAGANGYSGTTAANLVPYLTDWPASCSAGPKGEMGDVKLPDDVKAPWWMLRLPITPGTVIKTNDIIADDLGRRYTVSSAELSEYGWRLTARQNVS